jgi:hypothetical protein
MYHMLQKVVWKKNEKKTPKEIFVIINPEILQ